MKAIVCIITLALIGGCGFEVGESDSDPVGLAVEPITTDYLLQSRELAYGAYSGTYGVQPTDECKTYVRHLTREYLPQAALRTACGTTQNIGGCSYYASQRVYIEDVLINSRKDHAHEFLHIVLGCMRGDTDHDHAGPAWGYLAWLIFVVV